MKPGRGSQSLWCGCGVAARRPFARMLASWPGTRPSPPGPKLPQELTSTGAVILEFPGPVSILALWECLDNRGDLPPTPGCQPRRGGSVAPLSEALKRVHTAPISQVFSLESSELHLFHLPHRGPEGNSTWKPLRGGTAFPDSSRDFLQGISPLGAILRRP